MPSRLLPDHFAGSEAIHDRFERRTQALGATTEEVTAEQVLQAIAA